MKKRILSGMRPTGRLHLGHLVGALYNWTALQKEYQCLYMVADWHALMSEYENPQDMHETIIDNVADWVACGVDPEQSTIFVQSHVKEHLELFMVFALITPLGLLERCPTYKEQLREVHNRDLSTYGFLGYPVLQAADIMLYKAEVVPVGEDQLPHLELTREIARKFNHIYKHTVFPEPQALLTKQARLLGLDGRKMSKSYNNSIMLSDEPADVAKKVQSMFTDPARVKATDPGHPEKCNVHSYYDMFFPEKRDEVAHACRSASMGCTACKKQLAEALVNFLAPIQERRRELLKHRPKIRGIIDEGNKKAHEIAQRTMGEVKELLKLSR